ncbi:MAG: ABC transporter substrate-binding protein [Salinivirgaceae bacterium]
MLLKSLTDFRLVLTRSIIPMFLFVACQNPQTSNTSEEPAYQVDSLRYAQGFILKHSDSLQQLQVINPWQHASQVNFSYLLSDKPAKQALQIHTPVKRVVCLSTTHLAFIVALNEHQSVVGLTNPNLVSNSIIRKQIAEGDTRDVGNEQALNYETILDLNPDVIFAYSVGAEAQGMYQKFSEWGIPVVMVAEYLETSPLAKAEWIKFFARFFNKSVQADSIFNNLESSYNNYKKLVLNSTERPKILSSLPFKDVWYVPGGNSFMARFIYDAGGSYLWATDTSRESLALSIEHVFHRGQEADIWIHTGLAQSVDDIVKADPRMANLRPIKLGKVYNNNKQMTEYMGNDFWESGVMHPHLILKDLIRIFHPQALQDTVFTYYQHLP